MPALRVNVVISLFLLVASCQRPLSDEIGSKEYDEGTFGYDLDFLSRYDTDLKVLESGDAKIIVSPKFQGKIFTSTFQGNTGRSQGWINYEAIRSGEIAAHINAYGGEDRLWLGPEGGPFSIYFAPESEMVFANWQTPSPIDSEPWDLISASAEKVSLGKAFSLSNYQGSEFDIQLNREVSLLSPSDFSADFGIELPENVSWVGFESKNELKNVGDRPWESNGGTVCLWVLGMFNPSDNLTVLVPYQEGSEAELGEVMTSNYFGEIPSDRLRWGEGLAYFKGDGNFRSKLGMGPKRAKDFLGSYDAEAGVLTLVSYNNPLPDATYLNQVWGDQDFPFKGDAINAYNDGPLPDGSQMGPFYELETVSPAAFLQAGEELVHTHRTYHLRGESETMDDLLRVIFGVDTEKLTKIW